VVFGDPIVHTLFGDDVPKVGDVETLSEWRNESSARWPQIVMGGGWRRSTQFNVSFSTN
jgi:hypothetical protein